MAQNSRPPPFDPQPGRKLAVSRCHYLHVNILDTHTHHDSVHDIKMDPWLYARYMSSSCYVIISLASRRYRVMP